MPSSQRLLSLMQALRRLPPPVTAARLADELGVSPRTIHRDIEALRGTGAIIDGAAGFGFTLIEDGAMPPQALDRLEAEAVVLGLAAVAQFGDPALARAAEDASAKIVASVPERRRREVLHAATLVHFHNRPQQPGGVLELLRNACWDEVAVEITYTDRNGQKTERVIEPLALIFLDYSLALLARCRLRQDYRSFFTDRIGTARRTESSFRPRRAAMLRERLAQYGIE